MRRFQQPPVPMRPDHCFRQPTRVDVTQVLQPTPHLIDIEHLLHARPGSKELPGVLVDHVRHEAAVIARDDTGMRKQWSGRIGTGGC
jgi:hypothetical protein